MKKIIAIAVLSLTVMACKKDTKTVTKVDPKTGKTVTVEVPVTDSTEVKNQDVTTTDNALAIAEHNGVYTQQFKLQKGETYPLTTFQRNVQTLTSPDGKTASGTANSTDEMSFTVVDFKDGVYDIDINILGKSSSQSANGKTVSVDTKGAAPKDANLKAMWSVNKALVGNKLKMKLKQNGEIVSISGFDTIYNKVNTATAAFIKDAKEKSAFLDGFKQSFNEKAIKEQLANNLAVLPKAGAKIGQSWTESENASADGSVKLTTKYTLKSVENGIVTISVNGGIPKKTDKQTQEGVTHSISSELSQSGTVTLDQKTGWIKNQNISVKTNQAETLSDGKQTQTMKSNTTTTVIVNPQNK